MPIHVYDTATSRPAAIVLRPGRTPSGVEVRGHLRRLVRRIRSHWPATRLVIRGDGHYGRPEVMAWCEARGIDFIFGLPGNAALARLLEAAADDVRVRRAEAQAPVLRRYAEIRRWRSALANQVRLVLHTAAYWLMLTVRDAIPRPQPLGQRRVHPPAHAPDQGRRPHHRDRDPGADRVRRRLPRGRAVPPDRPQPSALRTLTDGA